jgi:hypothetical protein
MGAGHTAPILPMRFRIYKSDNGELSGGINALRLLGEALQRRGYEVEFATQRGAEDDQVAVYPEIVKGNPFWSKTVVRWLLNRPGALGGDGIYKSSDLVFSYGTYFEDRPVDGLLQLHVFHEDLFVDRHEKREGECYVVRKAVSKFKDQHTPGSLCIDGYRSHEEVADIFNRCERFISYDHATSLSLFAAMCGCDSIVIPDGKTSAEEWRHGQLQLMYGIAYGNTPDELEWMRKTRALIPGHLKNLMDEGERQVDEFVEKVRKVFNERPRGKIMKVGDKVKILHGCVGPQGAFSKKSIVEVTSKNADYMEGLIRGGLAEELVPFPVPVIEPSASNAETEDLGVLPVDTRRPRRRGKAKSIQPDEGAVL